MLSLASIRWPDHILQIFSRFLCKERRTNNVLSPIYARSNSVRTQATDSDKRTDAELARSANSDPHAFSILFDRYFTRVYQFHSFRIRQKEDAEDLTSETFTKIFQKIHTFTDRGIPFSVWVFTIARHTLIDFTRRTKDDITSLDALEEYQEPGEEFDHNAIDRSVLIDKLWKATAVLPEKQQQIWALKLSSGLTHREIGEILGMTENNVNVAISRSVKTLRKYLAHAHADHHA